MLFWPRFGWTTLVRATMQCTLNCPLEPQSWPPTAGPLYTSVQDYTGLGASLRNKQPSFASVTPTLYGMIVPMWVLPHTLGSRLLTWYHPFTRNTIISTWFPPQYQSATQSVLPVCWQSLPTFAGSSQLRALIYDFHYLLWRFVYKLYYVDE